jgi:carbonic anhydrase
MSELEIFRLIISSNIEESIREDVALLKASPLIKKTTSIVGLAYDIKTGLLSEVVSA